MDADRQREHSKLTGQGGQARAKNGGAA
jgi:hypothetical protein